MNSKGVTLIELLVVLAMVAILSALAVPSYSRYVSSAKIRTAQSDLEFLALKFEHRYQRILSYPAGTYASTAAITGVFTDWIPGSKSEEFVFSRDNASASTYTIKATGSRGGIDGCVVSLTHDGVKSISTCSDLASSGEWL